MRGEGGGGGGRNPLPPGKIGLSKGAVSRGLTTEVENGNTHDFWNKL